MLTSSLRQMRRLGQRYLLGDFELLNAIRSLDKYGRETLSYTVAATVKGQMTQVSGSERELLTALVGSGIERMETAKVYLPWGTAATAGQFIRRKHTSGVWNIRAPLGEDLSAFVVCLITREVVTDG